MENKHELPKGTILKSPELNYKVEEILGSGGFGITYKVSTNVTHKNANTLNGMVHVGFVEK